MIDVLVVDDSRMFRKTLKRILGSDFNVIGEAADGNDGFEQFKTVNPRVTLLDVTMPNCDGRECLKKIMEFDSETCVIMVSGINDTELVQECLLLGAKGFVNKSTIDATSEESRKETVMTINSLVRGVGNEIAA